jgi:hypothetical protein
MMTREQVEALLVVRLEVGLATSRLRRPIVEGQVRALAAVLTGKTPPHPDDFPTFLDFCGIPYRKDETGWTYDAAWLRSRGFEFTDTDHPNLAMIKDIKVDW